MSERESDKGRRVTEQLCAAASAGLPKHSSHSTRKAIAIRHQSSSRPGRPPTAAAPGKDKAAPSSSAVSKSAKAFSPQDRFVPAVAVFARAVEPGKTKTRLIPALGPGGAAQLHQALVSDALRKVAGLAGKAECYVFTAGGGPLGQPVPGVLKRLREGRRDPGRRPSR